MAKPGKNETERRCALSRSVLPTGDLIRFVADPSGAIVADIKRTLPGRGVWIEARRESIQNAVRKSVFARSLKRPVTVSPDLPEDVEALLRRRALSFISLANKAGAIVQGFAKITEALNGDEVDILLHASDGAADGTEKLNRKAAHLKVPSITEFTIEEMSLALGRQNVVHAAGLRKPATEALCAEMRRLTRFRDDEKSTEGRGGPFPANDTAVPMDARPDVI